MRLPSSLYPDTEEVYVAVPILHFDNGELIGDEVAAAYPAGFEEDAVVGLVPFFV